MANIVKKGYLDVKKRSRLNVGSPYKPKFVIIRRDTTEGSKVVEIRDKDGENEVEYLLLDGLWSVQDKTSKKSKRFAFELVIGPEVAMTFACNSATEREHWTESFRLLDRVSSHSPPPQADDMFAVFLEHSLSAIEVGVSGPCLLRIQDSSIVLYSECGRNKLHHWSIANVHKMEIVNEQVVLEANRAGSDVPMEFRFNTEAETAKLILTSWSMVVMQNLAACDAEKLNRISKFLHSQGGGSMVGKGNLLDDGTGGATRIPKALSGGLPSSSKQSKSNEVKEELPVVRRAQSFNSKLSMNVRRSISPVGSSRLSVASQGSSSYTVNAPHMSVSDEEHTSPPAIPPRVIRPFSSGFDSSNAKEDPDYSYIKDDEVEGKLADGGIPSTQSTSSVDRQLDDLLFDIMKDNQLKKQKDKKIQPYSEQTSPTKPRTLGPSIHVDWGGKTSDEEEQASDYLEPVPSKKAAPVSHHAHSVSLPATITYGDMQLLHHSPSDPQRLKQPLSNKSSNPYSTIPDKPAQNLTISTEMYQSQVPPELPPRVPRRSQSSSDDTSSPPLPPRSSRLSVESDKFPFSSKKVLRPKSYTDSRSSDISPYATTKNFQVDIVRQKSPGPTPNRLSPSPPPLPPRSPVKRTRERCSSSSSGSAMLVHRCPKCNGRKSSSKMPVSKTVSLNDHRQHYHHHHHHHHHRHHANHPNSGGPGLNGSKMVEATGSLPDLHKTSPIPENQLSQSVEKRSDSGSSSQSSIETSGGGGHSSAQSIPSPRSLQTQETPSGQPQEAPSGQLQPVQPTSPSSPPPYLQVLDESTSPGGTNTAGQSKVTSELGSALEVLSTCVKDLQTLESRVTYHNGSTRGKVATDLDAAIRQAMTVRDDLQLAMKDPKKAMERSPVKDDKLHRSATVSQRDYHFNSNGVQPSKARAMIIPHSPVSSPKLQKRGSTIGFSAPPIPPRSIVSLKSAPEIRAATNNSLQRMDSTGSVYGNRKGQSPNHSIHLAESTDVSGKSKKKLIHRHTSHLIQVADTSPTSQGSTVFVHHIRNSQV